MTKPQQDNCHLFDCRVNKVNSVSRFLQSSSLSFFHEALKKEPHLLVEGLWDAPKALLLLLAAVGAKKNILVITGEKRENRLLDDLSYFKIPDVYDFPSWETLPGEEIAPSLDIVGKRLMTLYSLLQKDKGQILLCPLQACLQKVVSPKTLLSSCHTWKVGDTLAFDSIPTLLTSLGYHRASVAGDKGEFALRGGIIDLFPISAPEPYRIDFFGDQIETIRTYDPVSQKSSGKIDAVFVSPASESKLLKEEQELTFLPAYLGDAPLIVFDDLLALEDRYVALKNLPGARTSLFGTISDFFRAIEPAHKLFWTEQQMEELSPVKMKKKVGRAFYSGKEPLQELEFSIFDEALNVKRWAHPFVEIADFFSPSENIAATDSTEILLGIERLHKSPLELHLISSTESEEKMLKQQIEEKEIHLPQKTTFERGYLSSGFVLSDAQLVLLPMTELNHRYKVRRQKWRNTYPTPASEFHQLEPGDLVVHFHHGVAKYLGIEKRANHLGHDTEYLILEYAEGSKLYVPIASAYLVSRYIGAKEESPSLNVLGTNRWQHARQQAQKAIVGYAKELLHLSAQRATHGGFIFPTDSAETHSFEEEFPFVETEDQLQAIADCKGDMTSSKAMDRLVCGDVGYGKTEVAMRAAFKAVADGKKQVAVLVPTTVLAMQHYETFRERMANYPINIGIVTRFFSRKEIQETIKKVRSGAIDILIGTHRLIGKDVLFKDLGLIIIDEEQRFGVRAKEHLKKLKVGVDCLTLSATPIPRTLYLSLVGAKDISIINTPPQDRLPIKSHLSERDATVIQNALLRELSRDGQAYFIHNRVETLFEVSQELQKLLPQARIVSVHAQMSADEIDEVFHLFKRGEADVLVATTIIENGIDIPNANTILIDHSEQFGLADLYQLRGRVGRWNRPAYAYFLIPKHRRLPELASKRLRALMETMGFGGGMKIAMRDLEIRGAGDILGVQQSGQVSTIGFHLYCKLLKRAIDALKKQVAPSFTETKLEFAFDAQLPEDYINETSLRMELYHRLGEAMAVEEVDTLLEEMKDRFGKPPLSVFWLIHLTRLRVFASQHQITLLKFENQTFSVEVQRGKNSFKKSFPLPRTQKPADLEKQVVALLTEWLASLQSSRAG